MSGGTQTSTSTTGAPAWLAPAAGSYLNRASQLMDRPFEQSPQMYSDPNSMLQQGWQATANRAMQGSAPMNAANTQLTNTINGDYLNSNPYLDQNIQAAQSDMTRGYNETVRPAQDAMRARSGSFGNSGVEQSINTQNNDFTNSLGRIGSTMRGQNYATERGNQMSAMGMAPGFAANDYNDANALLRVGQQAQDYTNQGNQQNYQWWQEARNYPREQLGVFNDAIGTLMGNNRSTTTTQPGSSWASQAAGGALTAAQLYNMLYGSGSK